MSKEFKLTKQENPHRYEELGLHLCFFERRIRGEDKVDYIVMCEEDSQILVSDMLSFPSWESMKEELPTLKSILVAFAHDTKWDASWRNNERVAFIKSVRGNEGSGQGQAETL